MRLNPVHHNPSLLLGLRTRLEAESDEKQSLRTLVLRRFRKRPPLGKAVHRLVRPQHCDAKRLMTKWVSNSRARQNNSQMSPSRSQT